MGLTMTDSQPLSPLSAHLRKWRLARGMSVSALAREAGIAKSTVSELERGHGNPSLDTLWALSRALNISLGSLFVSASGHGEVEVSRLADAPVMAHEGEDFVAQLMAGWRNLGEVELAVVSLAAGARRNSLGNAIGVVERALCVQGVVEVGPNERTKVLEVGDMLTFLAHQPHIYHALGGPARLVVVQQYPAPL